MSAGRRTNSRRSADVGTEHPPRQQRPETDHQKRQTSNICNGGHATLNGGSFFGSLFRSWSFVGRLRACVAIGRISPFYGLSLRKINRLLRRNLSSGENHTNG